MQQKIITIENLDHIRIFKTNIKTVDDVASLRPILSSHPEVAHWNVDLEDSDCVLRIVSETLKCDQITELLKFYGFSCMDLE